MKAEQEDDLGGLQVTVGKGAYKWGQWKTETSAEKGNKGEKGIIRIFIQMS